MKIWAKFEISIGLWDEDVHYAVRGIKKVEGHSGCREHNMMGKGPRTELTVKH